MQDDAVDEGDGRQVATQPDIFGSGSLIAASGGHKVEASRDFVDK